MEDGHEEGGDLAFGDGWVWGVQVDYGMDEGFDFGVGEDEAVAFVADDVQGVDAVGHFSGCCRVKAAGRRSAKVASAVVPLAAGK